MAYIGNSPGVASQRIVTTFTATSNQTTFTPQSGYTVGYIDVYHNGVRLVNGDDYTASNGTTVVLASGAAADDVVETVAYLPRGLSDGYTKSEADARYMSINEETLPSQTGNSGEFLTTDGTNASWAVVDKTTVGLSNVENKSSETIRGEITSGNVTTGLGYTPVNKAGDTMTGALNMTAAGMIRSVLTGTGSSAEPSHEYATPDGSVYFGAYKPGSVVYWDNRTPWETQIQRNGSKHFGIDSSGRVTTPQQIHFHAGGSSNNNNFTHTGGDAGLIPYPHTVRNVGNGWNSTNNRFTVPVTGVYFVAAQMRFDQTTTYSRLYLSINGTNGWWSNQGSGMHSISNQASVSLLSLTFSGVVHLNANDYIEVRGGPQNNVGIVQGEGSFSGYLLG